VTTKFHRNSHDIASNNKHQDPAQEAIADGRRIYVGNLLYAVKKEDVSKLFADHGCPVEKVDMSVDPFTGRNPSYCFVEFHSAGCASTAVHDVDGACILGRPVKIKPCVPKSAPAPPRTFDRYERADQAKKHWIAPAEEGRRVYVGGLPKPLNGDRNEEIITSIFSGMHVYASLTF
jgi:hypothetical protein